ncbi:hypothetical protein PPMP20_16020 [Paraburkholderia phymatum]|uniref:Cell wall surface anchor family protein n=1 Tax=Paraburkholderia phymatum (strain DSM 17167 / CIP 108236 / LMG 21445 / STM815) TaxID=391038 RepID=B2JQ84_PARP8|nr:hypothetical protein [Paraburkholderia phymatum]ACC73425.1 conserved hypothetical protein [Paraburkholderia phymatum STM815]
MADSAESTIARPVRARSQKPRASTVSPETENKLARAARSAQRLAQLSDAARDHSTLDLFPDDIARAEQQALNIDVRQGTLQGFELPDVVLAAAGAPDGVGFAAGAGEGKGGRAARGAAASKNQPAAAHLHDGQMVIDTEAIAPEPVVVAKNCAEGLASAASVDSELAAKPDAPTQAASLAAASVVRSVAALRAVPPSADAADAVDGGSAKWPAAGDDRERPAPASTNPATPAIDEGAPATAADTLAPSASAAAAISQPAARADSQFAPQPQSHAPLATLATLATLELDHARATAFADTVDALYGVIADQRRAAADHTRRMKWLLSIVVCALLMSIAIGIAQTMLLFRLAHQSTAHEQRIEQMLLSQQATLATLLDTDSSTTSLPVSAQPPAPAAPALATAPAKPAAAHVAPTHHTQRRKSAHTH